MSFFMPQPQSRRRLNDPPGTTGSTTGDGTGSGTTPNPTPIKLGFAARLTDGPFLTSSDLLSGAIAGGVGMASGHNEMNSLKTLGVQIGSSVIGRSIERVLPEAVSTLKPLVAFAISNAVLNSVAGRKKNLLQKVAVGTAIDLGTSAFLANDETSVF
jgi:hypothetical protein